MRYLMGIDNGGTFSKAALFDEAGRRIAEASVRNDVIAAGPGQAERDLDVLWRDTAEAVRTVIMKSGVSPDAIAGVSFCGHGKGLYIVAEDGRPAWNGIMSTDTRAREYARRWTADGTWKAVYGSTYQDLLACQPACLLRWFKDNEPRAYRGTRHVFSVVDYLRYRLTGEAFAEFSIVSGSNLLNLSTSRYDDVLLERFGIPEIRDALPPLIHASGIAGYVTRRSGEETLLPEGIPVAAGMFDIDACGIASGLVDESGLCMIAGTWSINEYISRVPVLDGSSTRNSLYCIPGYFLVEESSPTSAGVLEWFIGAFMDDIRRRCGREGGSVYDLVNGMVSGIGPGESDLVFLPFLHGSADTPGARGTLIGLTPAHDMRHVLRAVFEGVVFSHLAHLEKLLKHRERPGSVRLSGGAAKSEAWVRMFADILQIPIEIVAEKETGAAGAALAAGVAAGIYRDFRHAAEETVRIAGTVQPRTGNRNVYERKYRLYGEIADSLASAWNRFGG